MNIPTGDTNRTQLGVKTSLYAQETNYQVINVPDGTPLMNLIEALPKNLKGSITYNITQN
jgi:hypothetical protein